MEVTYLWVDKIISHGGDGIATDLKKIHYNLELMGEYGKELEQAINIKLLLVNRDVTAFSSIGRFICIITFEKNENKASMALCDYRLRTESTWQYIAEQTYPGNTIEFMENYRETRMFSASSEIGLFELTIVSPL